MELAQAAAGHMACHVSIHLGMLPPHHTPADRMFPVFTAPLRALTALVLCALASGCAMQPVSPGASREEVLSRYGTPSRVVALATGTRLQYSRQPAGQSAVMVDLDAAGRVTSVREVLNPAGFSTLVVGQSSRDDTERALGSPASVDRVASWSGDILTYRWRDADQNMLYWFYFDTRQVLQRTAQGMEFPIRPDTD